MSIDIFISGFVKCAQDHGVDPKALVSMLSQSEDSEKQANWLTDLYTKWRTGVEIKESDDYRKSLGLKPFNRTVLPAIPGRYPLNKQNIVQVAQNYSDQYAKNSIAKPKVYHQGSLIAR